MDGLSGVIDDCEEAASDAAETVKLQMQQKTKNGGAWVKLGMQKATSNMRARKHRVFM